MLQLIRAVAQFERSLINERRKEGVEFAKKRNVKFGRPEKLNPDQVAEIQAKIADGQYKKSLDAEYGISRSALYEILKRHAF